MACPWLFDGTGFPATGTDAASPRPRCGPSRGTHPPSPSGGESRPDAFPVLKPRFRRTVELQLEGIHHVEHDHLMPPVAEELSARRAVV